MTRNMLHLIARMCWLQEDFSLTFRFVPNSLILLDQLLQTCTYDCPRKSTKMNSAQVITFFFDAIQTVTFVDLRPRRLQQPFPECPGVLLAKEFLDTNTSFPTLKFTVVPRWRTDRTTSRGKEWIADARQD